MAKPKPVSVLIIDDNEIFLKTISAYLVEHHAREIQVLGTARSGRQGINLAQQLHPQVVLLDLKMPEMHGFDVIPLLRRVLPEVKIITTTLMPHDIFEQSGEIYRQANAAAGADAFIPKHNLTTDLIPTIQKMMQSTAHREVTP
ncbi:MAG: response regulator transcription factor [Anaerolineales bacterium]|nr:response regulator transcription factor [Anaerolineales bacterium]